MVDVPLQARFARLKVALGLDHVQIAAPAGCEPAARRFYGELLGLTEVEKPEPLRDRGGVWFELAGGRQLHVGVEEDFAPARKAHPALRADRAGLDALAERIAAAGAPVRWDEELAVRRFYTEDPWGNRLEVLAAPAPDAPSAQTAAPRRAGRPER